MNTKMAFLLSPVSGVGGCGAESGGEGGDRRPKVLAGELLENLLLSTT